MKKFNPSGRRQFKKELLIAILAYEIFLLVFCNIHIHDLKILCKIAGTSFFLLFSSLFMLSSLFLFEDRSNLRVVPTS